MEAPRGRILVVDDEPSLTALYRIELEAAGYGVAVANTGHEALEEVRRYKPDLVVMDIRIPDIDGLELMGRVLAEDPDVRIVLNSGYACYRDSFLSWSADAYVIKSSDLTPLMEAIDQLTGASRRQRRSDSSQAPKLRRPVAAAAGR